MDRKKGVILLVDDEEMIRRLLSQKLSAEGYRCEEAANAGQKLVFCVCRDITERKQADGANRSGGS
ncbi:MAG: hypothetical protein NT134_03105 [Chloroflexi bacterium]|nr:hypothetical protein [Chloroflexota bacterium]